MTKSLKHKYVLRLDVHLGSSPVSSLSVVTDSVVGSQSDPLWQWSVLLLSLSHFLLDSERLLSLIKRETYRAHTKCTIVKNVSNNVHTHQCDAFTDPRQYHLT